MVTYHYWFRFSIASIFMCIWGAPAYSDVTESEVLGKGADKAGTEVLETMQVIGVSPIHGVGLAEEKLPYPVQSATSEDMLRTQSLDLSQFMNRNLGSVTINAAQNNPLQPDLQYRGFSASPLLGVPQGISVFQNGVRIQEPFGDTINWELLPENAIASMNLIGGSNPLFGLNTLGGAISVQTKNGFTHQGHSIDVYGGSWGRVVTKAESGWNNGQFGYFGAFNYFTENGWRDASESDVKNFFGTLGWRSDRSTLDASFTYGNSDLVGNGAAPVQLLEQSRKAIFTSPDQTRNDMKMGILEGTHWFTDNIQLSGNAYYRRTVTNSFNGDGSEFEECTDPANIGLRCEEVDGNEAVVFDQFGNPVTEEDDAINNMSKTVQDAYGFTLNNSFLHNVFDMSNQLIIGGGWNGGDADFNSRIEIAQLNPSRSTTRTGRFADGEVTMVNSRIRNWSLYVSDTLAVTPDLNLTFSGRFNSTSVILRDRSGINPELNGEHQFERFNPAGGITWQANELLNVYAGYSESTRAPTPVELVCSDPEAPCNLPNAFLADPPLEQVVAKTVEAGFRGDFSHISGLNVGTVNWHVGGFHTINKDDIIFQSTGGATANQGFFANIGDTRRVGAELGLDGTIGIVKWFLNYSYVHASYRDSFRVSSPNHPFASNDGTIAVNQGNSIPGIPNNSLKFGSDINVIPNLTIGYDAVYNSGQYLRGDEGNLLNKTDGYIVFNLRGEYRVSDHFSIFAKIDNLFNTDYETFGLLGDPQEVLGPAYDDPRFLGPAPPRGAWGGIRLSL
jgi:iron complex outermembrane recepter protein